MSALSIQPTFPIFTDTDGSPLENGYIWIGATNLNPQTSPITAYWDAALTIPATQPIRTLGGYPSNAGTPGRLYVDVSSSYSILVQNKNGSLIYSAPAATEREIAANISYTPSGTLTATNVQDAITEIVTDLAAPTGSSLVGYIQAGTGAVARTVQGRLREVVSAKDFGAVGDGATDDAAALQTAFDYVAANGGTLFIPAGTYLLQADNIELTSAAKPFRVVGDGMYNTTLKRAANLSQPINMGNFDDWSLSDFAIDGGFAEYPVNASHGVAFFNCNNVTVERIYVYNYKNTGILGYYEDYSPSTQDNNNRVVDCLVDGLNNSNNGILLANMWASHIINCHAVRIGKTGSPCYALQIKNGAQRCSILGGYAEGARIGVAMGTFGVDPVSSTLLPSIGNIVQGVTIKNCDAGLAFGAGGSTITNPPGDYVNKDHVVSDVVIDMANTGNNALDFNRRSTNIGVKNLVVKNLAAAKFAVRFLEGDSFNTVDITSVDNVDNVNISGIAYFSPANGLTPAAEHNLVRLHTLYQPTAEPTVTDIYYTDVSGTYTNRFIYEDLYLTPLTSILNDEIEIVNAAETHLLPIPEGTVDPTPSSDDLSTITGGVRNQIIMLTTRYNTHTVTVKHGVGNIQLAGGVDMVLNSVYDTLVLRKQFFSATLAPYSYWVEVSRSSV